MNTSIRTHEGRVALVTGAAQGIGRAIALALAERGAQVIATDLTPPHETIEKIGPAAHAFQLDVTQEEDWLSLSLRSRDLGEVDIVVNNVGYFPNRSIDDPTAIHWGFVAENKNKVDEFYEAAMSAGARDNISPRARLEYYPGYYAADVCDPDGYSFEVVHKS